MSLGSQFVLDPDRLESIRRAGDATICPHGRNPCYVFCGIRRVTTIRPLGPWEAIPEAERWRWLGRVSGLLFRDREHDYDANGGRAVWKLGIEGRGSWRGSP